MYVCACILCLSYLCRSPPPQVPGQLPVGVESYNADYHIGNRMKIRCVHDAHISKNMTACCVCVCVCVCVVFCVCVESMPVPVPVFVSVCVVCLCVSLLVSNAVYRFPLPVSTDFKHTDIYVISI